MKKGYWVVAYRSVADPSAVQAYAAIAGPVIQAAGGKVLVRSSEGEAVEAGLQQRTVVIEFESYDQAQATYKSPEYAAALKALGTGAERDFRILPGV